MQALSQKQAAELSGITARRLRQLDGESNPPPKDANGNYPPRAFGDWLRQRYADQMGVVKDGVVIDYNAERARLTKAQADNEELKTLQTQGELVSANKVSQFFADTATAVKNRLRSLPTKVGPRVKGMNAQEATAEIRAGVDEALSELGRRFIQV